jgi:UMF1 family MFS transporter
MLLALSPPEKVGEFFGVYVLTDKLSAVLGPTLVGILLTALEGYGTLSYRIAVGSLALAIALGLFLLLRVPDARPDPNLDEFSPEDVPDAGA